MIDLVDFSFNEDLHEYRNSKGAIRPSVTQCLTSAQIFNFDRVPRNVLGNARRRGKNVHRWTQEIDTYGFLDPSWPADDELPYIEAWHSFCRELKPHITSVEIRMMGLIAGIEVGGTPDRVAYIGASRYLIDLKCTAAKHAGWALQLASYEMLLTGKPRCGHMGRMSVQLFPTGRYSVTVYKDPRDAEVAIAAIAIAAWDSQANHMNADHAKQTLDAWKFNHGAGMVR